MQSRNWITIICILLALIYANKVYINRVEYQMENIRAGDIRDQMNAAGWLADRSNIQAIPYMIEKIDDTGIASWKYEPKGGNQTMGMVMTKSLQLYTHEELPVIDRHITDPKELNEIQAQWQNWYDENKDQFQ